MAGEKSGGSHAGHVHHRRAKHLNPMHQSLQISDEVLLATGEHRPWLRCSDLHQLVSASSPMEALYILMNMVTGPIYVRTPLLFALL